MQKMQNQRRQEDTSPHSLTSPEIPPLAENDRASPLPAQASSVIPAAGAAAGGVKKKKPKKKK